LEAPAFFPAIDTRAKFTAPTKTGGSLLDIGSSDGQTLRHLAELRPDLRLFATDIAGQPEKYPPACQFHRCDIQTQRLPWPDASMDAITCMHLVEHLQDLRSLMAEISRLLKPGGRIYIETPHVKSLNIPSVPGCGFTLNFYDDATHTRIVPADELVALAQDAGLRALQTGISRNWLFAAMYPLFLFLPPSHKKFTAYVHWTGWSAYVIAQR
jgi:SAM-dependent methyltransferase